MVQSFLLISVKLFIFVPAVTDRLNSVIAVGGAAAMRP